MIGAEVRGVGLDIGFVCRSWHPAGGEIAAHTHDLARGLIERGHRVHVLCIDEAQELASYSTRTTKLDGIEVRRMGCRRGESVEFEDITRDARAEDVVMAWLAEFPCDVIHVHHLAGFGAGALRAIHEMGRPLVMTLHDDWLLRPPGATVEHTRIALELAALPQRLLAPSQAALEVFARAGLARERMHVCEHGAESSAGETTRDLRTMTLDIERHYVAVITAVTGVVPPFAVPFNAPQAAAHPADKPPEKGLFRRLFGR